jgi:hypothetical protein
MNNTQIAPLEEAENKSTKKIMKKKTVVKKVMSILLINCLRKKTVN